MNNKTKGIVSFLLLAFGIAWISWEIPIRLGLSPHNPLFQLAALPGGFAPAIAAIVVRQWITHEGFADAGLRPNLRKWSYYLVGWLLPLAVTTCIVILAAILGLGRPDFTLRRALAALAPGNAGALPAIPAYLWVVIPIQLLITALIVTPILWGEEFDWRGYLQMRLLGQRPLLAAVATGVIWGMWHLPLNIRGYNFPDHPLLGLLIFPVSTTLISIIFGWLRLRTGSIWASSLAHAATNAVGGSLTTLLFAGGPGGIFVSYLGTLSWIPCGKATSGYGGMIPVKGGITVDFWRMRDVLSVDEENLTVTVEPGLIWQDLEQELAKRGLALRLYPSSAPTSTVGGWLAQGGFGYGSFEYGAFSDNVVSACVALPSGEVRLFSGPDLDLIADAEGITGIITQITLRVRPLEDEIVLGAQFTDAGQMVAALREVVHEGLSLWSISFINPAMARLKNRRPPKIEHNHPVEEKAPTIPEEYVVIFVYPASRGAQVASALEQIVTQNGGQRLSRDLTDLEWEERFKIMHIKRLGPSLIPTELVIPLKNLDRALDDIEGSIHQPLVMEGVITGGAIPQAVLLGFIPHDMRAFGFNLACGLSLSAIQKAKRYGGRAYASGLYFAREADNILGAEQVRRLQAFKEKVDPQGIMNPGKIMGNGLLGAFMGAAAAFEPVVRLVANQARAPIGERIEGAGKRGIPDDVAWYAYTCAQCGYCVDECDQFYGRGWESESPRAKWFFLREYMAGRADFNQQWVDKFIACTTCEYCNVDCQLDLPNEPSWLEMRGRLVDDWAEKLGIEFPFEVEHFSQTIARRIKSGDLKFTHPVEMKVTWHDPCHMGRAGGNYEAPRQILQAIPGIEFVEMEHNREHAHCCGGVLTLLENPDTGKVVGDVRVREAEAVSAQAIIASCPCCEVQLRVTMEKTGRDMPVIDLGHLAAEGLGMTLPNPTAYALEQWNTFEAMIWLLKPEAMAELMEELFPQMVDAMPLGMGGMMRAIGRMGSLGGAVLGAMKPLFPILFPTLMPGMMPKVMPDMLAAVEKRVPMPDYMKEQMPDLMPMAMDHLMPKMLPAVVPLIEDPLVAYLRGQ